MGRRRLIDFAPEPNGCRACANAWRIPPGASALARGNTGPAPRVRSFRRPGIIPILPQRSRWCPSYRAGLSRAPRTGMQGLARVSSRAWRGRYVSHPRSPGGPPADGRRLARPPASVQSRARPAGARTRQRRPSLPVTALACRRAPCAPRDQPSPRRAPGSGPEAVRGVLRGGIDRDGHLICRLCRRSPDEKSGPARAAQPLAEWPERPAFTGRIRPPRPIAGDHDHHAWDVSAPHVPWRSMRKAEDAPTSALEKTGQGALPRPRRWNQLPGMTTPDLTGPEPRAMPPCDAARRRSRRRRGRPC